MTATDDFDDIADQYDALLDKGLEVTGEDKEYFARGRISWLSKCLGSLHSRPTTVLDYGCGTGASTQFFVEIMGARAVVGVDVSAKSVAIAQRNYGSSQIQFQLIDQYKPRGEIDLAFCNGVFHHIAINDRVQAVRYIYSALRENGLLAFWENNPWNPGAQYVMNRCPFDRDAVTLSVLEARSMLRACGFEIIRTDFLFIFPRIFRWLRWVEPTCARLPLGGQYQVLCRKQ